MLTETDTGISPVNILAVGDPDPPPRPPLAFRQLPAEPAAGYRRFFAAVIRKLQRSGLDIVSLDEMYRRLTQRDFKRRFVCLTFDDGYRDNLQWAYPILKKHEVPFTLYVPTSISRPHRRDLVGSAGTGGREQRPHPDSILTGASAALIARAPTTRRISTSSSTGGCAASETEDELRAVVRDLAARYGIDMKALCDELCMSWEDIAELSRDPLVTIGAHTATTC